MAKCPICKREMLNRRVTSCDGDARRRKVPMIVAGKVYDPIAFEPDGPVERCHDCGVLAGQIHHFGCDREDCPICGGQLVSCGCFDECFKHLCDDDEEPEVT